MGSLQHVVKPFPPGIHVPSLTWFGDDDSQEIDWDLQERHLNFLITSGLHGSKRTSVLSAAIPIVANPK